MTAPTLRLLGPNYRRLIHAPLNSPTARQLIALGWHEYTGPARATTGINETFRDPKDGTTGATHHGVLNGWIIPGTDPAIDKLRLARTGSSRLS